MQTFGLDKVILIPSATPPHKPGFHLATAEDRYEMVEKSIVHEPGFEISDKELVRQGPSFTIDTVFQFKNEMPEQTHFFLLMGSDAFLDILTWKDNDQILQSVSIIVMLRGVQTTVDRIVSFVDEHLPKEYIFERKTLMFIHNSRVPIHICMVPKIDISSTMVRERVKNSQSITGLVPDAVETLIQAKELYK